MKTPEWILCDTVRALQERLLSEFGGLGGLRDEGLLDSALNRAPQLFNYGKPTIGELSAAYTYGLVCNPPFIDGNKRIGFSAAIVFLEINGYEFIAEEAEAVLKILTLPHEN